VDYLSALNQRLAKGSSPENNAVVLLVQALGPRPDGGGVRPPEYFQRLGIECPVEDAVYFISWTTYLRLQLKNDDGSVRDVYSDPRFDLTDRPWTAKDHPEIIDWLKANEKPLELAIQATRRQEYYEPLLLPKGADNSSPPLLGAVMPILQGCRELASALICRAMRRLVNGDFDGAWNDILACHRLARLVGRGGKLIELLVGIAIDRIAEKADVLFVEQGELTSNHALACLHDLRHLPPMAAVADKIDLGERLMLLDAIMFTARTWPTSQQGLSSATRSPAPKDKVFTRNVNLDPAFRNANTWTYRLVAGLRTADRTEREKGLTPIDQDVQALRRKVHGTGWMEIFFMAPQRRGEMIGDTLILLMMPAFNKLQHVAEAREQFERNLYVAFALAAYQRDHNRYAAKLEELAPNCLEKVPDDLFSGKPLIYRPEGKGYLLYSVGVNGIDEDRRGPDDEPRGDDLSVRIPVPELLKPAEPAADRP
jgi:hypothetical protein